MSKLFRISVRKGNRFLVLSAELLRALNKVDFYAGSKFLSTLLQINNASLAPEHQSYGPKPLTYAPDSLDPNKVTAEQFRCLKWFLDGFRELDVNILKSIELLDYGVRKILS